MKLKSVRIDFFATNERGFNITKGWTANNSKGAEGIVLKIDEAINELKRMKEMIKNAGI